MDNLSIFDGQPGRWLIWKDTLLLSCYLFAFFWLTANFCKYRACQLPSTGTNTGFGCTDVQGDFSLPASSAGNPALEKSECSVEATKTPETALATECGQLGPLPLLRRARRLFGEPMPQCNAPPKWPQVHKFFFENLHGDLPPLQTVLLRTSSSSSASISSLASQEDAAFFWKSKSFTLSILQWCW